MEELLRQYKKMGFKMTSTNLWWNPEKKEGKGAKDFSPANWKTHIINKSHTALCIDCKESKIVVLDLDVLTAESNIKLGEIADKYCNMKVKTAKGYHYYFSNKEGKAESHNISYGFHARYIVYIIEYMCVYIHIHTIPYALHNIREF